MSDFLKGNYPVPRRVEEKKKPPKRESDEIAEELRERALASISGSMVYVERTALFWDGDDVGEDEGTDPGAE